MKPPRFAYHDPRTTSEAVALKAELGDEAAVLSGGQSLVPLLNMRLASPRALIDVNGIAELQGLRRENGTLVAGAVTRQYLLESDETVAGSLPLLAEAATWIGHEAIRHRGTVGGSLAHADPSAELPIVALALGAELHAASQSGIRTIAAADFFAGFMTTGLRPDEILVEARFPVPEPGTGWGFVEVARRHGDFALAAAAALVRLGDDGAVAGASIALGGISDRPVRATAVEQGLIGIAPVREAIASVATLARQLVTTSDDIHATRSYRQAIAVVVVERALKAAAERAGGQR
jgi:carbon-monoxide dehydrogenase medium subunit